MYRLVNATINGLRRLMRLWYRILNSLTRRERERQAREIEEFVENEVRMDRMTRFQHDWLVDCAFRIDRGYPY
jgi:hypothetical protein